MIDASIQGIACFDLRHLLAVLIGMRIRFLAHLLRFVLAQAGRSGDGDLLLLVRGVILGRDIQDAVSIDVERHLDLRHAARRRRNTHQVEFPERAVVWRHFALALQHVDLHGRLIVRSGRESLRLARRNRRVARDQHGHHAAEGLDAQGKRRHVEQQDVLHLSAEHSALNRGADGDDFVRIHSLVRFLAAEQILDDFHNARNPRRAANENHLVNLVGREPTRRKAPASPVPRCAATDLPSVARVSIATA